MNIFFSYFQLEDDSIEKARRNAALSFAAVLSQSSATVDFNPDFTSYGDIEYRISHSQGLVAFWDNWWSSSTWKAIELHYAATGIPSGLTNSGTIVPIPVFLYLLDPSLDWPIIPGAEILPPDNSAASKVILAKLSLS